MVPLRDVSLEAIQRYDERHEISPRPDPMATTERMYKGVMPQPQGQDGNVYALACLDLG